MTEQKYFQPSQNIVLRTLWQDRIWSAGPQTVIQDKPELLAFHIIPGTLWKSPCALNGGRVTPRSHARGEFVVNDEIWTDFYCLRLKVPGSDYSVELFFNLDLSFRAWYINMETPFRRTASGSVGPLPHWLSPRIPGTDLGPAAMNLCQHARKATFNTQTAEEYAEAPQ